MTAATSHDRDPHHVASLDEEGIVHPSEPLERQRIRLAETSPIPEEEDRARRGPVREQPIGAQRIRRRTRRRHETAAAVHEYDLTSARIAERLPARCRVLRDYSNE